MAWFTGILIYVICWWLIWFMVLPIGMVTQRESGEGVTRGTPESAPAQPKLGLKALATTVVAGAVWGVIYYLLNSA